jgi:transposase
MAQHLRVADHLNVDALRQGFHAASDRVERAHYQVVYLAALGWGSADIATASGYSVHWVRTLVRGYNQEGVTMLRDRRHDNPGQAPLLDPEQAAVLAERLEEPPRDGGLWSGPKVACAMAEQLGRAVGPVRGWEALCRLGYSPQRPRRRHVGADAQAQAAFQGGAPAEAAG